jgi:hypothetical protein
MEGAGWFGMRGEELKFIERSGAIAATGVPTEAHSRQVAHGRLIGLAAR